MVVVGMSVSMIMTVAMPAAAVQVAPRADRDPGAEPNQRHTRDRIHPMSKPSCECDSANPNDKGDRQSR